MRYLTLAFLAFLLLAAVCPLAVGQAVAEYGLGAGRAATTTAPASSAAQGISGVFDNLSKAAGADAGTADRKSTRLNSSHSQISYAVFCLKKKKSIILRFA